MKRLKLCFMARYRWASSHILWCRMLHHTAHPRHWEGQSSKQDVHVLCQVFWWFRRKPSATSAAVWEESSVLVDINLHSCDVSTAAVSCWHETSPNRFLSGSWYFLKEKKKRKYDRTRNPLVLWNKGLVSPLHDGIKGLAAQDCRV